jgi:drug/metabolite transporter (DMT)-like permease
MTTAATSNARGIAFMCTAMLMFIFNDTLVKLAAQSLPVGQIMALRGIAVAALFLVGVWMTGHLALIPKLLEPKIALRSVLEAVVAVLFITALAFMPIAELMAIFLTAPLMMTAASALIFRETVGWRRWAAVIAGFAGAMMIVKPSPAGLDIYALLGLASAALAVVRDMLTRRLDPAVPSIVVSLGSGLAVTLSGLALALVETWHAPSRTTWLTLSGAALVVAVGNYTLIVAFRVGEASVLAPFRYLMLIFALIVGALVFGDQPDAFSLGGMAVIGASGIYVIHRERVRAREARAAIEADAHQRS